MCRGLTCMSSHYDKELKAEYVTQCKGCLIFVCVWPIQDYKKPLEESNPSILSSSKISTLFHRLPEILQCHTLFRIALAESIRNWDRDERIGDVFVASFSKAIVLDIYSGFINNFSVAMDLAKMESKRKSAFADFLKVIYKYLITLMILKSMTVTQ